jgi:hypothetical protein
MATFYYPLLTRDNYAAFNMLMPDLPDTYDQWEHPIGSEKRRQAHAFEDFEAKCVPVDPSVFRRYCEAKDETPTRSVLERYATEMKSTNRPNEIDEIDAGC